MKIVNYITFIALLGLPIITAHSQKLKVFDSIPGRSSSEHYLCRVKFEKEDDSAWKNAYVLQTTAKAETGYFSITYGWTASWIAFESDFKGDNVLVEISKKDGTNITKAMLRPVGAASPATIVNGKAYVTLSGPANINVDIDGQMEDQYTGFGYSGPPVHTISLFANPVFHVPDSNNTNVKVLQAGEDINLLNRADWDTITFAPGIHNIGMPFEIHDNEVLFIPGDAIVKGTIHPLNAWGDAASQNFKVYGSGTISGEDIARDPTDKSKVYKTFTNQAEGAHLEGFVVADPAFHTFNMNHSRSTTSSPNIYKNLKILAWRVNSDGVNAFRNSEVSDCFFRTQDDAFYLGSSKVNQHDNVVWNDANGAVLYLQSASDGSSCNFNDITVIYHRAQWHWWDGGRIISMRSTSPGTSISNVHIKNVLIEDPLPAFPPFYATMVEGTGDITLNNIILENVYQEHDGVSTSSDATRGKPRNSMLGLDNNRKWENITFNNCYFNGNWLTSFSDGNFDTAFTDTNTVKFNVIFTSPVADFLADFTTVTQGQTINFTDASANSPNSWKWTFEGGVPAASNLRNPSVNYSTPGTYEVTLVALNGFGSDTIVKSNYITVKEPVPVDTIRNTIVPDLVAPGDTVLVIVNYETTQTRDLRAFIQLNSTPWTSYGSNTVTVSKGSRTDTIEFAISSDIPIIQGAYKIVIDLLPVGGSWPDRIHEVIVPGISAIMHAESVNINNCLEGNLPKGESHQLIATVYPSNAYNKSITWSSSNTSIATVTTNGLVTGIANGIASIIVATHDGSYTDTCDVNVVTIPVSGVALNNCPSSELEEGTEHQLTAEVSPVNASEQSVDWSTSNASVAAVDANGLVSTVAAGTAIITVTSKDGGFISDCIVNVIVPIDSLINAELPDQVSPGDTLMISFSFEASQSREISVFVQQKSDPWTKYGSNSKIVNEGIHTDSIDLIVAPGIPLANDAYNISIGILPVGGDWTERLDDIIKANVDAVNDSTASGIMNYFNSGFGYNGEIIRVYPNPVKEKLNIEFVDNDKRTISIYSMIGRLLYFQETNEQKIQIDVQSFNVQQHLLILVQSDRSTSSYVTIVH